MIIDIKTIYIILYISSIIQLGMFYQQYKINKYIKGPGWWIFWNVFISLSVACVLLRTNSRLHAAAIFLQDPFLVSGLMFLTFGIVRFFEQKINFKFILSLYFSYMISYLFFFFVTDIVAVRTFLIDMYMALISLLSLYYILRFKTKEIGSTAMFNTLVLAANFLLFIVSSILLLAGIPHHDLFSPNVINYLQVFDVLFANLLLTFGLISMINQKLNSDVVYAKLHFEQIYNTTPDAIAVSRLSDGMYIDCNPGFKIVSGYAREEVIGKTSQELNIWRNLEDRKALAEAIREKGVHEGFETTFIRKDGTVITGFLSATLLTLDGVPHLLTVTRDISARKAAEEALRASEEQYHLLFNTVQEAMLVLVEQKLVYFNPMMIELTGYPEEELMNMDIVNLVHPDDAETVLKNYRLRLSGGDAQKRYPVRTVRKNGEIRWIELGGVKIDWRGKPATLTLITDITEKKLAEFEITSSRNKLERMNSEKDKFFSIIAHDLKSPFFGLLGLTDILAHDPENFSGQELKQLGSDIHKTANNLYKLLKNLLEWSQMQQGSINYQPKQLDLAVLIAENIETFRERSEQKGIQIINNASNPLPIYADEWMLNSIILNLISNAVKFTRRDGKIFVSVEKQPDNSLKVSVRDTGVGISQTDVQKLFRLDAKVKSTGTDGELSTGLGLLLCKEFVEKHSGKIWVESEEGKGSTFYFTLPAN